MDRRSKRLTKVVWSESASQEPEGCQVGNHRQKCGMQEAGERRQTESRCKERTLFLSMERKKKIAELCN